MYVAICYCYDMTLVDVSSIICTLDICRYNTATVQRLSQIQALGIMIISLCNTVYSISLPVVLRMQVNEALKQRSQKSQRNSNHFCHEIRGLRS